MSKSQLFAAACHAAQQVLISMQVLPANDACFPLQDAAAARSKDSKKRARSPSNFSFMVIAGSLTTVIVLMQGLIALVKYTASHYFVKLAIEQFTISCIRYLL